MHDANPTNKAIAQHIVQLSAEFRKRYGSAAGRTCPQFSKTMEDLGVAKEVIPYLGAVFLSEDEFRVFRTGRLGINWDEVERRTERIFRDLQHVSRNGDGFHESWIGVNGNGA